MTGADGIAEVVHAIRPSGEVTLIVMTLAFIAGVVTAVIKISPAWVERMNERARDRAQERAEDWTRLRDEIGRLAHRVEVLEETCNTLSQKVRECEDREANWMRRALVAESKLQGQGEIRQAAAAASAEVRLDDQAKKGATKK